MSDAMEVDGTTGPSNAEDKLGMNETWGDDDDDNSNSDDEARSGNFAGGGGAPGVVVYKTSDTDSDDDSKHSSGAFVLHDAVEEGNTEKIKSIVQAWLSLPGYLERLVKLEAAEENPDQKERAKMLAQVWQREHLDRLFQREDGEGCTALHVAVLERKVECVKVLLSCGACALIRCNNVPLTHLALSVGSLRAHQPFALDALTAMLTADSSSMVENNLTILLRDDLHRTCLHLVAEFDFASAIPALALGSGGQDALDSLWELKDLEGMTAAHIACRVGSAEVLDIILANDKGRVSASKRCSRGRTPLHVAAEADHAELCNKLLTALPAIKEEQDEYGNTALKLAQKLGCEAAAGVLTDDMNAAPTDKKKTLILSHEVCSKHYTCEPKYTTRRGLFDVPPENVNRLKVLLDDDLGILRCTRLENSLEWQQATECELADVLRVHDYKYVNRLRKFTAQLGEDDIGELDADTNISGLTFQAALFAAGSVCDAIDRVCAGTHRNAFCAVRPPGHHAGPRGVVTSKLDPHGSHGFCFLSNAAIGAAYARNLYRHQGLKKVAIVDFDVHHGNGTEACVKNLTPSNIKSAFETPFGELRVDSVSYKPWLNEDDGENVFFASIHGFGKREPGYDPDPAAYPRDTGFFYPADGENFGFGDHDSAKPGEPLIVDVGQNSKSRMEWRTNWRKHVLPALDKFKPDLIIISAGFDAHKLDTINMGYISALEMDYYWLTRQLQRIANSHGDGKLVSVLEGGYAIQGRVVSPFARSVCAHVAALAESTDGEKYDSAEAKWEQTHEEKLIEQAREAQRAKERAWAAAEAAAQGDIEDSVAASALDASLEPTRKRSRRVTKEVDYKAENDKLNQELEEKRLVRQKLSQEAAAAAAAQHQ